MECCGGNKSVLKVQFKDENVDLSALDATLAKYGSIKGSLITILQKAQDIYGYLPESVLNYVATEIGEKPAKVYGVATFYTQFRLEPVGEYLIMLCKGTACHVNGANGIEEAIIEELGIHDGETTEDNMFTLNNVACLGCCSLSPVMMINEETYGKLTPKKTKEIIQKLKMDHLEEKEA
ncbi:NADH-quinone oxidoreductase subunit NuoE [Alkalibaculum bacchi]|jgi:NADH-quinone oxidoreductase subunit E|uniref:NADH-quinone oxidoreductase subunit NuoE n=1 Tax=Alkalibaculum bacchi TaxID=645887 RepID=UPI0026EFCE47|nr:NADH-quinone oxidoreductase subunit NuoE [Alkalibaculum bacchi]